MIRFLRLIGRSAALLLALLPALAFAYPQFIAKGYTNCATCHYSPTGGGMANSYGHQAVEATFPDEVDVGFLDSMKAVLAKHDVSGVDAENKPALQFDLGLDTRQMLLRATTDTNKQSWIVIPMLEEVGGVLGYGPLLAYATLTVRPNGARPETLSPVSREHWLQYRFNDEHSVRLGRMVLPFGLRIPDHTEYTREDFGFNNFDQWYALEYDVATERFSAALAAFDGTLIAERVQPGERGAAGTFTWNVPGSAALGASLLTAFSEPSNRYAASLFTRWRPFWRAYILGELDAQRTVQKATGLTQDEGAYLLRVGAFAAESLDVYAEFGGRTIRRAWETTKLRYMLGADWKVLPWVELSPMALLEETVETGPSVSVLFQLHIFW